MLKRAFLIDNDAVFRLGLSRVLADEFAIDTVGSLDLTHDRTDAVSDAQVDLLILTPVAEDPESAGWLRQLLSPPREFLVVMLLGQQPAAAARELAALGADGFLLKPIDLAELSNLIAAIRRDHGCQMLPGHVDAIPAAFQRDPRDSGLTERESLIIRRTANGRSSAQIAAEFGISVKTAERYRRSIFSKLGVSSVAELTKFAVREGYTAL